MVSQMRLPPTVPRCNVRRRRRRQVQETQQSLRACSKPRPGKFPVNPQKLLRGGASLAHGMMVRSAEAGTDGETERQQPRDIDTNTAGGELTRIPSATPRGGGTRPQTSQCHNSLSHF